MRSNYYVDGETSSHVASLYWGADRLYRLARQTGDASYAEAADAMVREAETLESEDTHA